MKRAAVFAHYDRDGIVDDYVIYYLKALKEVAQEVIFVSCIELSEDEKSKLNGAADFVIAENHDEYDFGSYKRGFQYLFNRLNDFDELIFANDSCYGPLYPLKEVFAEMSGKYDFWGITRNKFGMAKINGRYRIFKRPHLQSFFLVFAKNVFISKIFQEFLFSVKHCDEKNDVVINYEIGLTELLLAQGFSSGAYINALYRFNHVVLSFWRLLVEKYRMPFVKCSVLRLVNYDLTTADRWRETLQKHTNYPVEIIEKNLERTRQKGAKEIQYLPFWLKKIFFDIIAIQPGLTKKYFVKLNKFLIKL